MSLSPMPHRSRAADARGGRPRRVVLLGASNLTKSIGTVLQIAQQAFGDGLEIHAALGHGRSYGRTSSILGRRLPGLLHCGLWPALTSSRVPTAALVTDIGNDILYEEPVERIVSWVRTVLDRLADTRTLTVVTLLPVDNLPRLSKARFLLMRSVFVPRCRLDLATVCERVYALNEEVRRLAAERGFEVVSQRPDWYGFDPIHIRLGHRPAAWSKLLAAWNTDSNLRLPRAAWLQTARLRMRVPHQRRLWGIEQRGRQPAALYANGTSVALY